MKFTIEGLSQSKLVEWGLDAADAVIIRWFADWMYPADGIGAGRGEHLFSGSTTRTCPPSCRAWAWGSVRSAASSRCTLTAE